jgi:hypothetical protein
VRVSRSCRVLARAGITARLAHRHSAETHRVLARAGSAAPTTIRLVHRNLGENHRVLARAGSAAPGRAAGLTRVGSTGLTRAGRVR